MRYENLKGAYLQQGFDVPGFAAHVQACLAGVKQPILAPCYALEGEQAHLDALHARAEQEPYKVYQELSGAAYRHIQAGKAKPVDRSTDPLLFECMQDACAALGVGKGSAFTQPPAREARFTAQAYAYQDMMWVFLCDEIRTAGLMDGFELCFMLGHEMGHAACYAHVQEGKAKPEQRRRQEMTADRAGLLAVLWRVMRLHPDLDADAQVKKALEIIVTAIHKRVMLHTLEPGKPATAQYLEKEMSKYPVREAHTKPDHPSLALWERMEALRQFAVSVLFVRCVAKMWGEEHPLLAAYTGKGLLQAMMG